VAWKKLVARLKKAGLSGGVVAGVLIGMILGKSGVKNIDQSFYQNKDLFPQMVEKYEVIDGDTFIEDSGMSVRLLGIDAPNRGEPGYEEATEKLAELLPKDNNNVFWLEFDRNQLDQFGRVLAWVWIDCGPATMTGKGPKFLPADYMVKSKNASNIGLTDNPVGCEKGKLVNEEMVKAGMAKTVKYGDRGELKYEKRIGIQ